MTMQRETGMAVEDNCGTSFSLYTPPRRRSTPRTGRQRMRMRAPTAPSTRSRTRTLRTHASPLQSPGEDPLGLGVGRGREILWIGERSGPPSRRSHLLFPALLLPPRGTPPPNHRHLPRCLLVSPLVYLQLLSLPLCLLRSIMHPHGMLIVHRQHASRSLRLREGHWRNVGRGVVCVRAEASFLYWRCGGGRRRWTRHTLRMRAPLRSRSRRHTGPRAQWPPPRACRLPIACGAPC
ncbi:hypothetical protein DFH09DRAFT_1361753, partial [Mycena vulgaris]